MDINSEEIKAHQIFHPYAFKHQFPLFFDDKARFVHYTGADAALKMFRSNEIWMRNATCMNDYMEIQYGLELLASAYRSETGAKLKSYINNLHSDLPDEIEKLFNGWSPSFARQTFLFCLSNHNKSEDNIGRLSMWRAYGSGTAIAIVLKAKPFLQPSDALRAYTAPVAYMDQDLFDVEFQQFVDNLAKNDDYIKTLTREKLKGQIFNSFRYTALSTKHLGFSEEREWRVVFMRDLEEALDPNFHKNIRLSKDIVVIDGTPQTIYKIPLENVPEQGLEGIEVHEILDQIIIGPTEYPEASRDAVIDLLKEKIPNITSKVIVSDIPVR